MKIHIDDKILAIKIKDKNEEILVKSFFTYPDMSKVFVGGTYDKKNIKNVLLVQKKGEWLIINSGFLREFVEFLKKEKMKVEEVEDKRTRFDYMKKEYTNEELKKYFPFNYNEHQVEALKVMLKSSRGLVVAPTSAGKSTIFNAFVKETNLPTLILVNKITLANQLYESAKEYGIENCGVWHSNKRVFGKGLTVATIGSVFSLPSFDNFKCLVVDETHNASAKQFQDFLLRVNYPVQFGFSATPNKGDRYNYALIRRFLGSPIIRIKAEKLIENKVMAKPKIHFIRNYVKKIDNWPETLEEGLINNSDRNRKIVKVLNKYNLPSLILITDVKYKQGEKIKAAIEEESNKRVVLLSGKTSSLERDDAIKKMENGEIDVIIGTTIFDEGVSIKNIFLYINASGGKSSNKTLQRIGRSLRMKEGKEQALVFDFMDLENEFTESHSLQRRRLYKKEGYKDITEIDI